MDIYRKILKSYWGYDEFRPLQLDIIRSVIDDGDTLGLLPTGGGKSIIFQVAGLSMPGLTIVVTPLIALMRDQVENLKKRGIKATAVYAGMTQREVNIQLDNVIYGNFKFLYLSPERLITPAFIERIPKMKINLITIDEAHCISQWGYDFRPNYLKIGDLRFLLPETPILALTATATPKVATDIMERLDFDKPRLFIKSFIRDNISYIVRNVEDKESYIINRLKKFQGCGIIYVKTRKSCRDISNLLNSNGISSSYYHGGLEQWDRIERQESWMTGKARVMVATNAFGMGIDKPDVRFVIHLSAPDSLEAYYQEAGRGGRDGNRAYAILLYNRSDTRSLRKSASDNFPTKDKIVSIYESLGNYFRIAIDTGEGMLMKFDIDDFSQLFKYNRRITLSAIKLLQSSGYLEYIHPQETPTAIKFIANREYLYDYTTYNKEFDEFIQVLLRSYSGVFTDFTAVSESLIARRADINVDKVHNYLLRLSRDRIISYRKRDKSAFIKYTRDRLPTRGIGISKDNYEVKRDNFCHQIESVVTYGSSTNNCRSRMLVRHFGESKSRLCGVCDYCLSVDSSGISNREFSEVKEKITDAIEHSTDKSISVTGAVIVDILSKDNGQKILKTLIEEEDIYIDNRGRIEIKC